MDYRAKTFMVGSDSNLDGPDSKVHGEIILKNGIFDLELMDFGFPTLKKCTSFCLFSHPLTERCNRFSWTADCYLLRTA